MSRDDVHGGVCAAGGVGAPRAEREVTHLAFHPARRDAAATGADRERADFGEDRVTRHLQPTHGTRGEWPPRQSGTYAGGSAGALHGDRPMTRRPLLLCLATIDAGATGLLAKTARVSVRVLSGTYEFDGTLSY